MVALIGGVAALILGIIGIISWWGYFLVLLKGAVPAVLILAGALAAYLGAEELRDKRRAELESAREPFAPEEGEVEKYKAEVAELRAKLEAMQGEESAQEAKEEKKAD